jgi:hypothetical protein
VRSTRSIRTEQEDTVFKSDGPKTWANRVLSFVVGGLVVLILMSVAAVGPVKAKNADLTKQLDELQNGAARLLSEAKGFMANKAYSSAQQSLSALLTKQPGTPEAVEGKKLSAEVAAAVELQNKKWEAASVAVKAAWEKTAAAKLRSDADATRAQVETSLAATLTTDWERQKDQVRKDWENAGEM